MLLSAALLQSALNSSVKMTLVLMKIPCAQIDMLVAIWHPMQIFIKIKFHFRYEFLLAYVCSVLFLIYTRVTPKLYGGGESCVHSKRPTEQHVAVTWSCVFCACAKKGEFERKKRVNLCEGEYMLWEQIFIPYLRLTWQWFVNSLGVSFSYQACVMQWVSVLHQLFKGKNNPFLVSMIFFSTLKLVWDPQFNLWHLSVSQKVLCLI